MHFAQERSHWVSEITTEQLLSLPGLGLGCLPVSGQPGRVTVCHHPDRTALTLQGPKTSAKGASAIPHAISLHQAAWAPVPQH